MATVALVIMLLMEPQLAEGHDDTGKVHEPGLKGPAIPKQDLVKDEPQEKERSVKEESPKKGASEQEEVGEASSGEAKKKGEEGTLNSKADGKNEPQEKSVSTTHGTKEEDTSSSHSVTMDQSNMTTTSISNNLEPGSETNVDGIHKSTETHDNGTTTGGGDVSSKGNP